MAGLSNKNKSSGVFILFHRARRSFNSLRAPRVFKGAPNGSPQGLPPDVVGEPLDLPGLARAPRRSSFKGSSGHFRRRFGDAPMTSPQRLNDFPLTLLSEGLLWIHHFAHEAWAMADCATTNCLRHSLPKVVVPFQRLAFVSNALMRHDQQELYDIDYALTQK